MKVTINADGREVSIECADTNTTPDQVADKALAVWQATTGSRPSEGPAFGLTQERREWQTTPMTGADQRRGGPIAEHPR